MNKLKLDILTRVFAIFFTATLSTGFLMAQEDELLDDEDIFVLSPFEVTASEDEGYLASETLAGTRIRTDLKDVASSVSVLTDAFFEDVAATNAVDLLVFAPNVEVVGLGGNLSGSSNAGRYTEFTSGVNLRNFTRVRGLAGADITRDYFQTIVPLDSYNVFRVDVNRGSNSFLFGLGSPAGIINYSIEQALFTDENEIEIMADQYGTFRTAGSFNKEIIEDKLAVRVAVLNEDREFQQKQAFENNERYYVAMTWKPWSGATVRGNYEYVDIESSKPSVAPPIDQLTTWWDVGNPAVNPSTDDWRTARIYPPRAGQSGNPFMLTYLGTSNDTVAFWYENPSSSNPTVNRLTGLRNNARGGFPVVNPVTGQNNFYYRFVSSWNTRRLAERAFNDDPIRGPIAGFLQAEQILDPSIYNYYENQLSGGNDRSNGQFKVYNLSFEQLMLDGNLGIEVAYNKEEGDTFNYRLLNGENGEAISLDINTHDFFGNPNPNYGRPVVSAEPTVNPDWFDQENFRVTAFYRQNWRDLFDGKLGEILGLSNLTGVYTDSSSESYGYWGRAAYMSDEFSERMYQTQFFDRARSFATVHYLGDVNLANASSAAGANIPGIQASRPIPNVMSNLSFYDYASQSFVTEDVDIVTYWEDPLVPMRTRGSRANYNSSEIESLSFTVQQYMLWDYLVLTAGWREDSVKNYSVNPNRTADGTLQLFDVVADPKAEDVPGSTSSVVVDGQETFAWNAVGHLPNSLRNHLPWGMDFSVHFAQSENFRATQSRRNILNDPLDPAGGETEEIGFTVRLFEDKLVARFNWYETEQIGDTDGGMSPVINGIYSRWDDIYSNYSPAELAAVGFPALPPEVAAAANFVVEPNADGSGHSVSRNLAGIVETSSTVSEGFEFEMAYNPLPNWRISFNASKQEARVGQRAPIIGPLVEEWIDTIWAPGSPIGDGLFSGGPDGANSFSEAAKTSVVNPYRTAVAESGLPVGEIREWRWNVVTNYSFNEGRLQGLNVGGSVRWQDEIGIGYPVIFDEDLGAYVNDVNNPYFGDALTNFDAWVGYQRKLLDGKVNWKIQLNIRNLFDNDDLIEVSAQPDGSPGIFRIPEGRRFVLTNTFSF